MVRAALCGNQSLPWLLLTVVLQAHAGGGRVPRSGGNEGVVVNLSDVR
jgi:hypothetical protein